ncbi:MAG: VOC family protein [Chloroflexota bacterium]
MAEPFVAKVEVARNHVALKVKDLDAAVHFYHDLVGLPVTQKIGPEDNPSSIFVTGIQLMRRSEDPGPNPYGIFDHVGIAVENIDDVCAHLDQAGSRVRTPLEHAALPGGRSIVRAYYYDPDGNVLELFHLPD